MGLILNKAPLTCLVHGARWDCRCIYGVEYCNL